MLACVYQRKQCAFGCDSARWHFLCTRTRPTTRWIQASMLGTHLSRLRLWRGSMRNVPSQVLCGGSNSSESALSFPILNPNKSKFGFRIEGDPFQITQMSKSSVSYYLLQKAITFTTFFFLVPVKKSSFFVFICSYKTLVNLVCRCREKQRKEASRLQTVNRKLSAMNKLLMEENDRLQKQVSHLVYENGYMKQQIQTVRTHPSPLHFSPVLYLFLNVNG